MDRQCVFAIATVALAGACGGGARVAGAASDHDIILAAVRCSAWADASAVRITAMPTPPDECVEPGGLDRTVPCPAPPPAREARYLVEHQSYGLTYACTGDPTARVCGAVMNVSGVGLSGVGCLSFVPE